MISDNKESREVPKVNRLKSIMKVQTVAIKAFHDFFEEKDFLQILPVSLSRLVYSPYNSEDRLKSPIITYNGQNLKLLQSMILHQQIALSKGLEKIFVNSSHIRLSLTRNQDSKSHSFEFNQIGFEVKDADIDDIFKFMEELLRRVKIDIEQKAGNELKILERNLEEWSPNFPAYSSHDLELEFGPDWKIEAPKEHDTPFWVVCEKPHFFDKMDASVPGDHYLNYSLYLPDDYGIVIRGSEREVNYTKLIEQMKNLNVSRYDFTDYLLLAQDGKLVPSTGGGIGIERLVRYFTGTDHIRDVQLFPRVPNEEVTI